MLDQYQLMQYMQVAIFDTLALAIDLHIGAITMQAYGLATLHH